MANAIPLLSPGRPGYVSPERMQAIYDSESHLRALFLSYLVPGDL